jgi:radical SAM superfamily enzyme YgiQ (UPF0313 family)
LRAVMRALLIAPRFPSTIWSYERTLELIGRRWALAPLSLTTVAALLPQTWTFTLVDCNVRPVTEADWDAADLVLISAMTAQREDFLRQVREAKRRGKTVAVGGPYPTALPDEVEAAGADHLVLDEGEITIPPFLEALARGDAGGRFSADGAFADLTRSPLPRFDLLDRDAYDTMPVQFSRGCPFHCEFCEVGLMFGRRARAKTPAQVLAELDRLRELGWDRHVFIVDDNFVGHRGQVRALLQELRTWQKRHGYPFFFNTEASVDLADAPDLLDLMVECNFNSVFLGLETPDAESLTAARKTQNTRRPLEEAVGTITRAGLTVMGSFIVGFDGERAGAGERVVQFVERTGIPTTVLSMLQALPRTDLWRRLEREGRLLGEDARLNPDTLMNFVPTRPLAEIAREYVDAIWTLYDPCRFLDRTYRHFLMLGPPRWPPSERRAARPSWTDLRAVLTLSWRNGVTRPTRWKYWHHLVSLLRRNPRVVTHYIVVCAHLEHFLEVRERVRQAIEARVPLDQRGAASTLTVTAAQAISVSAPGTRTPPSTARTVTSPTGNSRST